MKNCVKLYDVATGQEQASPDITTRRPYPTALAFSPDGRLLAVNAEDGVQLLNLPQLGGGPKRVPSSALPSLWDELASADSATAYRASCRLVLAGSETVNFLHDKLRPVREAPPESMARLLRDLGSNRYAIRKQATRELEKLGEAAEASLRKALSGNPSLDMRRRLEALLASLAQPRHERVL